MSGAARDEETMTRLATEILDLAGSVDAIGEAVSQSRKVAELAAQDVSASIFLPSRHRGGFRIGYKI